MTTERSLDQVLESALFESRQQALRLERLIEAANTLRDEIETQAFRPTAEAMLSVCSLCGPGAAVVAGVSVQELPWLVPDVTERIVHFSLRLMPSQKMLVLPIEPMVAPHLVKNGVFEFSAQALPQDYHRLCLLYEKYPAQAVMELGEMLRDALRRPMTLDRYSSVEELRRTSVCAPPAVSDDDPPASSESA